MSKQLIRRFALVSMLGVSLAGAALGSSATSALADDKELALRGLVDCGKKVETGCDITDSFFFWTSDISGGSDRVKIDITWIKPEKMPFIEQEDELCLTGSMREDQVYQAWSVTENCDEGTVNDKEQQREKKDDSKDKNKN